jgi:hypothetical protein
MTLNAMVARVIRVLRGQPALDETATTRMGAAC